MPPEPPVPGSDVLAGFREYLVTERGLAPSAVRNYLGTARLLAAQDGYLHLAGFTPVSLAGAVPSAASASPLPEAIGPGQASLLLGRVIAGRPAA